MLDELQNMSAKPTKKQRDGNGRTHSDDLAPEYRFDYKKSRPNRFARRMRRDVVVVILDSDVAEVFRDPKQVNALLRAAMAAIEKPRTRRTG